MKRLTVQLAVRDLVSNEFISGASVRLYENYEGENTCLPGANSKLIYTGQSNESGFIDLDFVFAELPSTRYTVEVSKGDYSQNCRTFSLNENR